MLHIGDTEAMNVTSETTPSPAPNVNQKDQTAGNDARSSNTPIRTSGRMLRNRNDTLKYAKNEP